MDKLLNFITGGLVSDCAYWGSWIFFYEPKNPNLKNLKKLDTK